jgi:AcrR family transcriptional regulator
MRDTADTRSRIQEIALRRFVEQGYEATSLREIAEELGVTKAALYYHFKTKEDIVTSLVEQRTAFMTELLEWAAEQPRTPEARRELVRRYAESLRSSRHHEMMRFVERNQAALRHHPIMEKNRDQMMTLVGYLSEPTDPPAVRLRSSMSLFALHAGWFFLCDEDISDAQRGEVALEVALSLIEPGE